MRDLLRIAFRHRGKMALVFVGSLVVCAAVIELGAPVYRSEARVLVRVGRESVALDPTAATGPRVTVSRTREQEINSELSILQSRELIGEIVDEVGVEQVAPGRTRGRAIDALLRRTRAHVLPQSSVIAVHCDSDAPDMAKRLLERWLDRYLEKHLEVHKTPGAYEFFAEQTRELAQRITATEEELEQLKADSGVIAAEGQRQGLVSRLNSLRGEREAADVAIETASARIAAMERQEARDPVVASVRQRLVEARLAELELLGKFQPESAPVLSVRERIRGTEDLLGEVGADRRVAALVEARAELAVQRARRELIAEQLAAVERELAEFNRKVLVITRLTRQLRVDEANFEKYVGSLEQARIDTALERARISNISIAQPATTPTEPVRPRPVLYFAIAVILGLLGAAGVAFGAEAVDPSLRTPERTHALLGLRCLASVPRRGDRRGLSPANVGLGPDDPPLPPDVARGLDELAGELLIAEGGAFAIVGARSGDGCSTITAGVAARIAASHGPVLVVDADPARRGTSAAWGVESAEGLGETLAGRDVEPVSISPSFALVPAGRQVYGALSSEQLARATELFRRWRQRWRVVLIDLGDASARRGNASIAALCDGTVLVVDAERTRWQVAARAVEALGGMSARVLGIVLNRRRFPIPNFIYRRL